MAMHEMQNLNMGAINYILTIIKSGMMLKEIRELCEKYLLYIFATYACGYSLAFIADELATMRINSPTNKTIWGRQIINNILTNSKYLGDEDYPKIVESEMFNTAQNRKNNSAYSKRYRSQILLLQTG